jgi:integrase
VWPGLKSFLAPAKTATLFSGLTRQDAPEKAARQRIDATLALAGWQVQDINGVNLHAGQDNGGTLTRQMFQNRTKLAARRAGCRLAGVHILRHTFCSHLAMRGAPGRTIQALAGHQELSMTHGTCT